MKGDRKLSDGYGAEIGDRSGAEVRHRFGAPVRMDSVHGAAWEGAVLTRDCEVSGRRRDLDWFR